MILLGIDLGTTVLKAAVLDSGTGRRLASASRPLPMEVGPDGRREQDVERIHSALRGALRKLESELGRKWRRIEGIGLATQGGSTIVVDRETGAPKTPMILWNDGRAFAHFHHIAESHPPSYWRSFSLRDEPGMGLARIEWLRERSPESIRPEHLFVGIGESVFHRFTGKWRQDACNALQIGCYDARLQKLTPKPLRDRDVPLSFFAPMRNGHDSAPLGSQASRILHLREGVPVVGPYNDHEAGWLAASRVSDRPLECSLGTAWVGNFRLSPGSEGRSPFQLTIPAPVGSGRLVIQPLLTGNVTWDWALARFVDPNPKKALDRQARIFEEAILPPPGLVGLPWVNRPNPWSSDAVGAGGLLGVGPTTSREDLLRAMAAGMCYELERVFREVKEKGEADSVVLCGGAARGLHFQQTIAALFDPLPVHRVLEEDAMGTRGCLFAFDRKTASVDTEPIEVAPDFDREALERGKALYREAFRTLYGKIAAGREYTLNRKGAKG